VIEVAAAVAVTSVVFLFVGLPFAVSLRSGTEGWLALLTDAAGYGVVVLTLAITAEDSLGVVGIILTAVVIAAASVYAIRRRVGFPRLRGRERPRRSLVIAWSVVALVAIAFRLHDSTFLPWVGDMGAYVNWANELLRTGHLTASWPPIYSVFLAIGGGILGTAGTTAAIPFTGFLLIAVAARLLTRMKVNPWIVVGIGGALAFNIHAIWYSYFPSSESLNAPVFLLWVSLFFSLLTAPRRLLPALGGMTFLVMLDLCLLRASGSFLLAPALLVVVVATILPAWRRWAPRLWVFFFATLAGAEVGVWYGVKVIHSYFVNTQVKQQLPARFYLPLKNLGLLTAGPVLFAALALLLVVAAGGVFLSIRLSRRTGDRDRGRSASGILAVLAAAALVVAVVLFAIVGSNIWFILLRMGLWMVVLAVVGLVLTWRTREIGPRVAVAFLAVATVLLLIAFQAHRLGSDRPHAFFLYWDRYLVSEVLPALAILAGIGAAMLLPVLLPVLQRLRAGRALGGSRVRRAVPAIVTALAVLLTALPSIPILVRESQDTYMAGADTFTAKLMSYTTRSDSLFWAGTSTANAPGFFFPNEWMAFAVPMTRSFGYTFQNVRQGHDDFRPDDVVSAAELETALSSPAPVFVYEVQKADGQPLDQRLDGGKLTFTKVGDLTSDISLLEQRPQLQDWTHAHIHVIVWRVQRSMTLG
jgi:hypothetical protein